LGAPATASRGKVLCTSVPVSIPTSMRPNAIAPDASVASYAARERKVNVAMAPVVPNPYATTSSVPQIHPYCAGQQGPLPYAVANPYVMYSPNASSFPSDPQSVGHAHIGYIPGVVPNPYGQQPK
uniref:PAM2 domain-containing protein n=1 Tax=Angiostrongylus cantonensis TaxID=6313 RepID=A0A0K0DPD7_ANGCA